MIDGNYNTVTISRIINKIVKKRSLATVIPSRNELLLFIYLFFFRISGLTFQIPSWIQEFHVMPFQKSIWNYGKSEWLVMLEEKQFKQGMLKELVLVRCVPVQKRDPYANH